MRLGNRSMARLMPKKGLETNLFPTNFRSWCAEFSADGDAEWRRRKNPVVHAARYRTQARQDARQMRKRVRQGFRRPVFIKVE
jgi:hypothetical protein